MFNDLHYEQVKQYSNFSNFSDTNDINKNYFKLKLIDVCKFRNQDLILETV